MSHKPHTISIFVIIPAGGSGVRFGGDVRKQHLMLGEMTLLERTLKVFLSCPELAQIVVALPEEDLDHVHLLKNKRIHYVAGGKTRAESVRNGFRALNHPRSDDIVLVHDAVRPLLSQALIQRVCDGVRHYATALPVVSVVDTIKEVEGEQVTATIDRDKLRAAQTPQGASYGLLSSAYDKIGEDLSLATDEAMLLENSGHRVMTVEGERENIKITTPFDLLVAEVILRSRNEV